MPRNYKREYALYHSKPEQKKNRSSRNAARKEMVKQGRVKKDDGKDVDHRDGNPLNNSSGNIRIRSRAANRGDKD